MTTPTTDGCTRQRQLLTVRDVAERLSVHRQTVRRLLHRGALPYVSLSGMIRIGPEAFEAFLASRRCAAEVAEADHAGA